MGRVGSEELADEGNEPSVRLGVSRGNCEQHTAERALPLCERAPRRGSSGALEPRDPRPCPTLRIARNQ